MSWLRNVSLLFFATCVWVGAVAQQGAQGPPAVDDAFVQKQFGPEFTSIAGLEPLTGDLDGDGIEDIVIPARAKSALIGETEFHYKTLDPYSKFFGVGDPKITSSFGSSDPKYRGYVLLIVHGAGADAWRAATPKAKFVLINIPFKQIALKHVQVKRKKVVTAIYSEENGADEMTSATYFDGRNYKYEPMGATLQ
ncbi:MAG TPA: hypothetical protein VMT53_17050 [Terriglobales bacterium]|nr:hypothetical protein [Terriglobales bacterium]